MATKITNAALIEQGKKLLAYIQTSEIPYVRNGMTLQGMDCQGLVEYCLIQAGVPKKECGLAGSNAHWRACVWRGTPAECIKAFGCIPGGATLFIWAAGHNDKYNDDLGEASHIGLVWGKYTSIAASAGREKVVESNFAGKAINGGWNMIGLLPWVDYGLSDTQVALLGDTSSSAAESVGEATPTATGATDVSEYYTVKKGCLGGAVRRLQAWLNELGYALGVDGDFGALTDAAVRAFQADKGLMVDGIAGKRTWAALAEARQTAVGDA